MGKMRLEPYSRSRFPLPFPRWHSLDLGAGNTQGVQDCSRQRSEVPDQAALSRGDYQLQKRSIEMPTPASWSISNNAFEYNREMGLCTEPKGQRDVDNRHRRIPKQGLGASDFAPLNVAAWGITGRCAKLRGEMHSGEADRITQL